MNILDWKKRLWLRSDETTQLVHLTRPRNKHGASYWLWKILTDKKLKAFDSIGICPGHKCVCFQEVPIACIAEVLLAETLIDPGSKRYSGYGIRIPKRTIFELGGRQVVYSLNKKDVDNPWRYSHETFRTKNNVIDWSHEREWRIPNDVDFNYTDIDVILPSVEARMNFIKKALSENRLDILTDVRSIIILEELFN